MRFSIIIPNYNKEPYLKECLDSVFNQTLDKSKYEVLFIDDGSTDNSLEIVKNYNVRLFHTNRKMAGGARNKGIENATGQYILFLDSDDYLYSNDVLEKLDKHITDEDIINLPFIKEYSDCQKILGDYGLSLEEKISSSVFNAPFTKCVKRSLLNNIRFIEEVYYEDVSYNVEILCNVKKESDFQEPVVFYRRALGSITKSDSITAKKMIDWFIQLTRLYYFCDQFPEYAPLILKRIKDNCLRERLDVLDKYFETGYNSFYEQGKLLYGTERVKK